MLVAAVVADIFSEQAGADADLDFFQESLLHSLCFSLFVQIILKEEKRKDK